MVPRHSYWKSSCTKQTHRFLPKQCGEANSHVETKAHLLFLTIITIQKILLAIPVYHMMYMHFSKAVAYKLQQLCKDFLWGFVKMATAKFPLSHGNKLSSPYIWRPRYMYLVFSRNGPSSEMGFSTHLLPLIKMGSNVFFTSIHHQMAPLPHTPMVGLHNGGQTTFGQPLSFGCCKYIARLWHT